MPIKMGNKTYAHFREAVEAVRRKKNKKGKKISNPRAYVAAIERKQIGQAAMTQAAVAARHKKMHG
jgi:hypothetical protein